MDLKGTDEESTDCQPTSTSDGAKLRPFSDKGDGVFNELEWVH
jgi:hypothetical protein